MRFGSEFCWTGYDEEWDCDVTVLENSIAGSPSASPLLRVYQKNYDGGANDLRGNCFTGSLLAEGLEQHHTNGRMLREHYIGAGPLKLFPSDDLGQLDLRQDIYLRSDDEPRTIASGHALIDGMFPPRAATRKGEGEDGEDSRRFTGPQVVPFHLQDYDRDWLTIRSTVCPATDQALAAAQATPAYQALLARQAAMSAAVAPVMGDIDWKWGNVMDCLVTSACTDRPIPVDEQVAMDIGKLVEEDWYIRHTAGGSAYARLGMAPLWSRLRDAVRAAAQGKPAPKFSLYSGHDTTIMPLLAAVGGAAYDERWEPYGSLLAIELYRRDGQQAEEGGQLLFRVVHNGAALAWPGCEALGAIEGETLGGQLCPLQALEDSLAWVDEAMTPEACAAPAPAPAAVGVANSIREKSGGPASVASHVAAAMGGVFVGVLVAVVGVVATRRAKRHPPQQQRDDVDSSVERPLLQQV